MTTTSFARLGTASTYDNAMRNISARQVALSNLQENLTSGKRVVRASDDPTSAGIAERALTRISRIATDQRALDSQVNTITQAESALGDVNDALQRFRELTVSAGNASFSPTERKAVALEMQGLRDQIFGLSNRADTNGLPLFGALGSALKPFVGPQPAPEPDYTFQGLPGQAASTEVNIPAALDGNSAFMLTPTESNGNRVSLFSVLDAAIAGIGDAANSSDASQTVSETLGNLDIGMDKVSAMRGLAGELLNRADRIAGNQEKRSIQMEADRSRAEDLDMVKGISDFQNQQTGYQAALQTYAQVQKISLFNYIG